LHKKAQSFSFDLLTALIIFGVILAIALVVIFSNLSGSREKITSINDESSNLADRFAAIGDSDDHYAFIVNNKIDQKKLNSIIEQDYITSKQELGLKNDFVIYFREEDESLTELKAGTEVYCYGSADASILRGNENVPCCSRVIKTVIGIDPTSLNAGCLDPAPKNE